MPMVWNFGMEIKRRWIWLRGLIRWKDHWGDFTEEFKKQFPNDEILLLDLPGFGDFYQEDCPKSMEQIIDHLDKRVDWTQGKYHILAFSLGAMVAAQWASRRPSQIEKMFLINTSDKRSPFYERFHLRNFWLLSSRIVHTEAKFVETGVINIISNRPEVRKKYLSSFIQAFLKSPFKRHNFLRQLRVASKARFPLSSPVPTVFMNSTADRLVSYKCSERIAKDWGSTLETHHQSGHDLTLDDPQWVLKVLQKHVLQSAP